MDRSWSRKQSSYFPGSKKSLVRRKLIRKSIPDLHKISKYFFLTEVAPGDLKSRHAHILLKITHILSRITHIFRLPRLKQLHLPQIQQLRLPRLKQLCLPRLYLVTASPSFL